MAKLVDAMVMASHGGGVHHYEPGTLKGYQCLEHCLSRCGKTQYHKPCRNRLCVPPAGYYGNKAVCPCYYNWKSKKGGPKCP